MRIETTGDSLRLIERVDRVDGETVWELQYEAALQPRALADFDARSQYLQTEPGLNWTEKPLVTRATSAKGGRVTLHRDRLRTRQDDLSFVDEPVAQDEWPAVLSTYFDISPTLRGMLAGCPPRRSSGATACTSSPTSSAPTTDRR